MAKLIRQLVTTKNTEDTLYLTSDNIASPEEGDLRSIAIDGDWVIQKYETGAWVTHTNLTEPTSEMVDSVSRDFLNGTFKETFDLLVASNGTDTITASLEQTGTGDLTMQFSDGEFSLDCTPIISLVLTAGNATTLQSNYIFIPQSTKVLTLSTTGWASEEHIKVAYVLLNAPDSDLPVVINQNWNDHLKGVDGQGHLAHITSWLRRQGAHWYSGLDGAGSDGYIDISGTDVYLKSTSGVVSQLHLHDFPSVDTSGADSFYLFDNVGTTGYTIEKNLNVLTTDARDVSLNNKYFNIVLWGVANKGSNNLDILCVNKPKDFYSKLKHARYDASNTADYSMPKEFIRDSGTGFLIAKITMKKSGTTYTVHETVDLRNASILSASGGGTTIALTEFSDAVLKIYNDTDDTKEVDFDLTAIANATIRTITMPDTDIDLGNIALNDIALTLNGVTGSRPASPITGQYYFDTTIGKPVWYDGTGWVDATGTTA